MTATAQVREAMLARLREADIDAVAAFGEETFRQPKKTIAALGVRQAEINRIGLIDYLGERYDEASGTVVEVYGKEMKLIFSIDIYAPRELGAEGCEAGAEQVAQALLSALPSGIHVEELRFEQTQWDKQYGMFLRCGCVGCSACFTAVADEEKTVLQDFILKGLVHK